MSETRAMPLVSISLPCYRQLDVAKAAIDSVRRQTYPNLEITLLDDGSSDEYQDHVLALRDPRVVYRRNPERLGAMQNMFAAILCGRGEYTMAFHEDDLLSAGYIAAAVGILNDTPSCGFVSCQLHEFVDEPSADALSPSVSRPHHTSFNTPADFVRGILKGTCDPMFGAVVYRRAAVESVHPDHDAFATLVDRPFLLSMLDRGWTAAVIHEPLVWYRHHGDGDTRHLKMTTDHVLRLLQTYRSKLPATLSKDERALFFSFTGYWLFELYRLTPPDHRPPVWKFLFEAWRKGLYDPRARGRFGIRQVQRALLNQTS